MRRDERPSNAVETAQQPEPGLLGDVLGDLLGRRRTGGRRARARRDGGRPAARRRARRRRAGQPASGRLVARALACDHVSSLHRRRRRYTAGTADRNARASATLPAMTSTDTRAAFPDEQAGRRVVQAPGLALPRLGHGRRQHQLPRRGRAATTSTSSLRLPVGAPHDHLPAAQGPRGRHLDDDRRPRARRARLGDHRTRPAPRPTRSTTSTFLSEAYVASDPDVRRAASPCPCCGTAKRGRHRQQRVGRHHPHVRPRVRRVRRAARAGTTCPSELRAEIDEINA